MCTSQELYFTLVFFVCLSVLVFLFVCGVFFLFFFFLNDDYFSEQFLLFL